MNTACRMLTGGRFEQRIAVGKHLQQCGHLQKCRTDSILLGCKVLCKLLRHTSRSLRRALSHRHKASLTRTPNRCRHPHSKPCGTFPQKRQSISKFPFFLQTIAAAVAKLYLQDDRKTAKQRTRTRTRTLKSWVPHLTSADPMAR